MKKQEIRRGFEWYRKLSKKQRKQFKANCGAFQHEMNRTDTFNGFISGDFIWSGSPQGHKYWSNISNKKF